MNELQQCMQMEVMGGGVTGFFFLCRNWNCNL